MTTPGVANFEPPHLLDRPWFDGAFFENGLSLPPQWEPMGGVLAIRTLAGTDNLQRLYTGAKSPNLQQAYPFDLAWGIDSQADYERLSRAKSRGNVVDFCAGFRVCDVFTNAVSGQTYTLSRPSAVGLVTGVTSPTFDPTIFLDDVEDSGAATVTGQSVLANASGELAIHYTALHYVLVDKLPHRLPQHNDLQLAARLQEVLVGDFG